MTNEIIKEQSDLKEAVNTYFATLTQQLTDVQKKQFLMLCQAHKLNPILGQVYAVRFKENFNIITNYYEYLKRADQTGLLEYHNIETKSIIDKATGRTMPETCTFIGKRRDQTKEMRITIYFREFTSGQASWVSKPFFMIEKCALANGLRRLFPNELGNMPYVNEELWYFNKTNEDVIETHIKKDDVKEVSAVSLEAVLKKVKNKNE